MDERRRHSIRVPGYDYSQEGGYFVTICASRRACLFGEVVAGEMGLNTVGRMAEREWIRLGRRFAQVVLDEFVVMPNHVHGIIFITGRGTAGPGRATGVAILRRCPYARRIRLPGGRIATHHRPCVQGGGGLPVCPHEGRLEWPRLATQLLRTRPAQRTRPGRRSPLHPGQSLAMAPGSRKSGL